MDFQMKLDEFLENLRNALWEFSKDRSAILQQDVHEDAITGEFAQYLKSHFGAFPYSMNHNYNRRFINNHLVRKQVEFLIAELPPSRIPKNTNPADERVLKDILPDIIFHDLHSPDHNFLMLEIKKSTNKDKDDRAMDLLKLKVSTSRYLNYDYGAFIDFKTGNEYDANQPFSMTIFEKGNIIHEE